MTLRPGQYAYVGEGLFVGFQQVLNNSRCPINARCITAGNAKIAAWAWKARRFETFELNTFEGIRQAVVYGYESALVDLQRGLEAGRAIPQSRYRAMIRVRKAGAGESVVALRPPLRRSTPRHYLAPSPRIPAVPARVFRILQRYIGLSV